MRFVLFSLLGLLLFSCSDIQKTDQLAKIDALNKSVDSLESIYLENRIDSIPKWSNTAYMVENRIKNNYVADTIDMELGRKMDAYKVMRKKFTPLSKTMNAIRTGIGEERTALETLRTDIDEGSGERDKYDEYIVFEAQKVEQLKALSTDFLEMRSYCYETFEKHHFELNSFSMSLLDKSE